MNMFNEYVQDYFHADICSQYCIKQIVIILE